MHLVPFLCSWKGKKDVVEEGAWHNSLPEIPSAVDQERGERARKHALSQTSPGESGCRFSHKSLEHPTWEGPTITSRSAFLHKGFLDD